MGVLVNLRGRRGRESIQDQPEQQHVRKQERARQSRSRGPSRVGCFNWLSGMLEIAGDGGDGSTTSAVDELHWRRDRVSFGAGKATEQ